MRLRRQCTLLISFFRGLCAKLYLKAETQQLDRILEEFSRRFWDCNPTRLYGSASASTSLYSSLMLTYSPGVVHAVVYSILLLNTDLHIADIANRMSRSQFVRNTMTAIQMQNHPSRYGSSPDLDDDNSSGPMTTTSDSTETQSLARSKRSGSIASWNSISKDTFMSSPAVSSAVSTAQPSLNSSTTSFQHSSGPESKPPSTAPSSVTFDRSWEIDMEGLLKVANLWCLESSLLLTDFVRKCTLRSRVSRSCNLWELHSWLAFRRHRLVQGQRISSVAIAATAGHQIASRHSNEGVSAAFSRYSHRATVLTAATAASMDVSALHRVSRPRLMMYAIRNI
jgi:hypothetical protein